ncbi:MAG TPA: polyamine aminopropyltransferase [Desulfosarcina sp.]|nr:polyamine aminopropyltransferase [Desulfosarcina sp.]
MRREFIEAAAEGYDQHLAVDELLFEARTDHQHLIIFRNRTFGRVLALDGVIQTTEADEFIYHEMMAHVPVIAHGSVDRVLIIGGGDGGLLREVLRHRGIREVVLVEIDRSVIDLCRRYLPDHSQGAFEDSRSRVVIDDGLHYLRHTQGRFDVVLTDSTDPEGPAETLFNEAYYAACRACLKPGGVLVTQNGVVFFQPEDLRASAGHFNRLFGDWHFFTAAIPSYVGGDMAFGWASDDGRLRRHPLSVLRRRFADSAVTTRYYTPERHIGAFALPRHMCDLIARTDG